MCHSGFNFSAFSAFAASPGPTKSGAAGLCKQAGRQGLHVCGRDLPESPAHLRQRPPVAHPGLLRPHGGGVRRALRAHSFCLLVMWSIRRNVSNVPTRWIPTPRVSRLCQGLEWMMSRLRVRWWPLTPSEKCTPALWFPLPPNINLNGRWWMWSLVGWPALLPPPVLWRCNVGQPSARRSYYYLLW